jgi:mannose-6-phosphate isomerase-like protein (cupin superfamily)
MEPVQRVVVVRPDEGLTISIGESSVRLLNVGDDTAEVSSAEEIRVPPHFDGPPSHYHNRTNHSWYVTEGTLRLTVEGEPYDLSLGGFVYVPVGSTHTFANVTSRRAAMVEFTTPGGFDRYLADLAAAFPSGTAINPEKMIEIMARHDTFPPGDARP